MKRAIRASAYALIKTQYCVFHMAFHFLHIMYTVDIQYVMVNVRAARRYGIYLRSFSIPDEGGARVWYAVLQNLPHFRTL